MSLSDQARFYMDKRDELSYQEREVVEDTFKQVYFTAGFYGLPAAKDDRAAELEAALIKFIIESREG